MTTDNVRCGLVLSTGQGAAARTRRPRAAGHITSSDLFTPVSRQCQVELPVSDDINLVRRSLAEKDTMHHRSSHGFRIGRIVLGLGSLVTLLSVSVLSLAQSYPTQTYPTTPRYSAPNTYRPSQRHVVRGAGRGAALGAIGGAIAGDAGKGAAAGAAMGGTVGVFRRRDERRRQALGGMP
jgi:Glycine-zipper domain